MKYIQYINLNISVEANSVEEINRLLKLMVFI
jgi:hypothetical protein